ncbi:MULTISPECIES: hypothetical protein [Lactiplantibacillus]|uniref:Uncharacterized protein n=2 Tax=Lactiplantibacillus plantarum TaxID=1590 RepID=A0A162F1B4_LACPN|nr:hypothetical protein [Lactiplantibacillus plantarum]AOB21226.1 hypothetical protein AVR82_16470 [Lactiplantibacillus plantarum]AOB24561.1 hypothetical protein AVR83_16515 [Lactiplantibacillus plantarum]AWI41991.1 hypothetical protein LpLQ80_15890 [Lactiplantibacillus plantarum]KZU93772.1 hypothetical protein A1D15_1743 [Lactiplantibacillus plantarum]KZU96008.1 hypothetical protein Lp19_1163 [Lactiplantibacillus plantarum]
MKVALTVQLIKLDRLSEPLVVQYDSALNQSIKLKPNDVVLIGCPSNEAIQIGIVKQVPVTTDGLTSRRPTVVGRIEWPVKPLKKLVAQFKLEQLMEDQV